MVYILVSIFEPAQGVGQGTHGVLEFMSFVSIFGAAWGRRQGTLEFHESCKLIKLLQEIASAAVSPKASLSCSVQVHQLQTRSGPVPSAYSREVVHMFWDQAGSHHCHMPGRR